MICLSNGRYDVSLDAAAEGFSAFDGQAITRKAQGIAASGGFSLWVREPEAGVVYRVGAAGARPGGERERSWQDAAYELKMELTISASPSENVETRRLRVTNLTDRERRLDVTSYVELVLSDAAADRSHPAFSKLFVQTAYEEHPGCLVAWRRKRSPGERVIAAAHAVSGDVSGPVSVETDRARFIGRGNDLASARAHGEPLSGTTGNVLDPVFSLRAPVRLEARGSAEVVFRLSAAFEQTDAVAALAGALGDRKDLRPAGIAKAPCASPAAGETTPDDLQFFNAYGGFADGGRVYEIRLDHGEGRMHLPPAPWSNVIANEAFGFIATERGSGTTWSLNSREHRLTPWSNDPVADPPGEAFFLRDERDGGCCSLMPGPRPGRGRYRVRHGFGYTAFLFDGEGLTSEATQFVPRHDPVKITRVRVTNTGEAPRALSIHSFAQWVLGGDAAGSAGVRTWESEDAGATFASSEREGAFAGRCAFFTSDAAHRESFATDREAFVSSLERPPSSQMHGRAGEATDWGGAGGMSCAATSAPFSLGPGASRTFVFLLGETADVEAAQALIERYCTAGVADEALRAVEAFWDDLVGGLQIETPVPEIDVMVNGWLVYQNLSCRIWGRTAFYQSGGAFGFRDQLQDAAALIYLAPERTRAQILLHAAHQFAEGDVLHWWHPPLDKGLRTRFSDDLLWLPYVTAYYVSTTGDGGILDEIAPFLTARLLEDGEDEAFLSARESGESADLYEHCCRALDRSLTRGVHGLPLMGTGDWNDGMNRVGREGRGESVWMGFFLYKIIAEFLPICVRRHDEERAARYWSYREHLQKALNEAGWDGAWYRRAYYDNGAPLGSAENDECRIDALAQAWAVLSGAAPKERADEALGNMERFLVSEDEGIIRLLTPAFDRTPHDPGYIKGYLPGVRENGGQYTHAALWAVRALAEAGRTDRAATLLKMLSPVSHAETKEDAERYVVEPYVIAADVYGVQPHIGRGGWTWYTGSAGWMWRVAVETLLGFTVEDGRFLRLQPRLPESWPGYRLVYRLPGTQETYHFAVSRAGEAGIHATCDGKDLEVAEGTVRVSIAGDGGGHEVVVRIG